ncbi:MAG: hypothetical protein M1833_003155 [Piccolia ochrophora]|nr:MAG: hypothetical protein M1833_003155 [Piccolia ochrophora]
MIQQDGRATYLGLILTWAGSFILFLWTVTYPLLSRLPIHIVALSIGVPTLYLWAIDTWALKRGTWVIADRTKLCIYLWDGLEIEEALFFLASNCLVVLGQIACEYTLAILHAFPSNFPNVPAIPSFVDLLRALALDPASFDFDRVRGLAVAVQRLRQKSRSFYLASATFEGRLRVDLIMLYSFCRVADDLIDYATTSEEVISNLSKLAAFLDIAFEDKQDANRYDRLEYYVRGNFPPFAHDALILLPFEHLSRRPLDELLRGFKTDSRFRHSDNHQQSAEWPISDESDLDTYAFRVAGTVAGLCLELVFANTSTTVSFQTRQRLLYAGGRMGMALQCVNIARDIETDARLERVYIPTSWLEREGLTPNDVMEKPGGERVEKLRDKLLAKADGLYREARPAIEDLPPEARASMRVAIESYMEIGRVLRKNGYRTKHGRASVPLLRRLWVAWRALNRA